MKLKKIAQEENYIILIDKETAGSLYAEIFIKIPVDLPQILDNTVSFIKSLNIISR